MDIQIKGDMKGIEAAREIRERFGIRTVYLTADADESTIKLAQATEPLGYLTKPFNNLDLEASIATIVKNVNSRG